MEAADAGIAQPREYELACHAGGDHLVVDEVRRQPAKCKITLALGDDLVTRREADQVREALDRHAIAVANEVRDGVAHRRDLRRARHSRVTWDRTMSLAVV